MTVATAQPSRDPPVRSFSSTAAASRHRNHHNHHNHGSAAKWTNEHLHTHAPHAHAGTHPHARTHTQTNTHAMHLCVKTTTHPALW
jgi:hypothetical protein